MLFANFAEAVAEGRGKAQADALRRTRSDTRAKRYIDPENLGGVVEGVNALDLRLGDVVLVEANEVIPGDGEILEGVASVNEFGDHRRVPRPSFARPAAIDRPSPAERPCCPTSSR